MMQQFSLFGPPPKPYEPPLVGYAICAEHPKEKLGTCTYMKARSVVDAFEWCIEFFPMEKGYIHLSVKNIDTQVERILMSDEFIGRDGNLIPALKNLTPERKQELIDHVSGKCEIALQDCNDCWEFYSNEGHDEYVRILTLRM